jgi:hypothetical protein
VVSEKQKENITMGSSEYPSKHDGDKTDLGNRMENFPESQLASKTSSTAIAIAAATQPPERF